MEDMRKIVRLAWPVLIAQLALIGNSVIDTAMAGRLSPVDLASVGIGASILVTVLMSLLSVLFALPPLIAHLYGANRSGEIGHELQQSIWISVIIAIAAILLLEHPAPFIAVSDLQPDVEAKVRAYLAASAWEVPPTIALRLFFGLSTGIGHPRPVMVTNLAALLMKIPLNSVFMFGLAGMPKLGGPGCAVATAVDAWLVAFAAWYWCLSHPSYAAFKLSARIERPDWRAILAFLRLGIPIGLTFAADVTAFTFMALFIARLGPVVSSAHQIAANLAAIAFMFPLSIGNATSVLAGQALGANSPEHARRIAWNGIGIGMGAALAISLTLWSCAPLIAALYTPHQEVRKMAIPLIVLVGFYHLADALQAVAVNALRGYKKSGVPMFIYTIALWGLGIGGGILLGLTDTFGPARGASGFWIAAIASLWVVAILVSLYLDWVSRHWVRR
jgi:MATE family multidrug resistance protein